MRLNHSKYLNYFNPFRLCSKLEKRPILSQKNMEVARLRSIRTPDIRIKIHPFTRRTPSSYKVKKIYCDNKHLTKNERRLKKELIEELKKELKNKIKQITDPSLKIKCEDIFASIDAFMKDAEPIHITSIGKSKNIELFSSDKLLETCLTEEQLRNLSAYLQKEHQLNQTEINKIIKNKPDTYTITTETNPNHHFHIDTEPKPNNTLKIISFSLGKRCETMDQDLCGTEYLTCVPFLDMEKLLQRREPCACKTIQKLFRDACNEILNSDTWKSKIKGVTHQLGDGEIADHGLHTNYHKSPSQRIQRIQTGYFIIDKVHSRLGSF